MNNLIPTRKDDKGNILVNGRDLHKFLKIETPYMKWFKRMIEYGFAQDVDFATVGQKSPIANGGYQEVTNHAMTIDMAKEISMIQRNEKGKQARQYFIQVEKEAKQTEIDTSNLSPELQMFKGIFDSVARQEQATKKLETKVDNGFKGITEIVGLNVTDWRKQTQALIRKMAKTQGGFSAYQEIGSDIYAETDRRAGSDLHRRLINLRKNMAIEGASKSKQQRANKLDVIENDKRLKEIYLAVVKDFAIKYQVWNEEY